MEKLGNFCLSDGKVHVIEYFDIPDDLAHETTSDGHLRFGAGSIAIHVISRSFADRLTADGPLELPIHRAEKTVSCIDDAGNVVKPIEINNKKQPNAVKLEMLIFDAFPLARETVILETERDQEFSPVKNADGIDEETGKPFEETPTTCLHDQVRRAAIWLEQAGIDVPRDADGQVAAALEISPLFADSAEKLAETGDRPLAISSGQTVYLGSRGQTGGLR